MMSTRNLVTIELCFDRFPVQPRGLEQIDLRDNTILLDYSGVPASTLPSMTWIRQDSREGIPTGQEP
jgi:hypothetical protein